MQLGSLWLTKDKNDNTCFTGEIDLVTTKIKIGVFKNTNKEEGSKQPDYRVVKLEDRQQEKKDDVDVPF